ncbi:MAG: T9SS type A sorting domain-containing protein [Ignavibacteriae bacterium]|nr:T9SS type A sorting domain-containing protein [Ignavibacteriota bacterium]
MKHFYLYVLTCVLLSSISFAQNVPVTFEPGGNGGTWTWTVFENSTNPALQVVANPSATGINTSSYVAQFTALQAGQPWAGCESQHTTDLGTFTLDATNCTIKMMVYKSVISDVGIKFATSVGGSDGEIKVANTKINEWEELTFDFSARIGNPASTNIDQIIVFPDFNLGGRTSDNVVYFDNITFSAILPATQPTIAAPTPTLPSSNVISLFSNAYTNVTVDTWSAVWDMADVSDVQIVGDDTKKYSNLTFAGIEFTSSTINATAMNFFHMDMWTPDSTALPKIFKLKIVDFGADGAWSGGDDVEHELTFNASSIPPLTTGNWMSFDIPLSNFTGLTTRGHLAQMIISGDLRTVFIDNVYFYAGAETEPATAAPTPTVSAENVISLFSNAYTNVTVDTWSAVWDNADVSDIQIAGNDTKKYTSLVFAGIEFTSSTINATAMNFFHMDMWTPDSTALPKIFKIKLVDFGADGAWSGGDDVEHELTLNASSVPALSTGNWMSLNIPLANFTGLTTKAHLAQLIISGDLRTVFIDNVYFYAGAETEPSVAAPTPTVPAGEVISLFSNAYTNVTVDTWSAGWDMADVSDVQIAGNDTKKYTSLVFAGIEFTSSTINASAMNYFHMDFWTPDSTASPKIFKIKIVDFGAGGVWGGGDDVEHELTFSASTTPALATGSWVSFDLPLSSFTGLTTRGHLAQMIISGDLRTMFIDNVYFYRGMIPTEYHAKWNMVSVPSTISNYAKSAVFPTATTAAFAYSGGYSTADILENGKGYWIKFDNATSVTFGGTSITSITIPVVEGWNMIGSISAPIDVTSITSDPSGMETSQFFDYSETGYAVSSSIEPGKAYWVKVNTAGSLILSSVLTYAGNRISIMPNSELPPSPPETNNYIMPSEFSLSQNYPNPFNPTTIIHYSLATNEFVSLKVFNMLGQEVATLVSEMQNAGVKNIEFDSQNLPSGLYFYKMNAGSFSEMKKMVIMK